MNNPPQEQDIVPGRSIAVVGLGVVIAIALGTWAAYAIGACSTLDLRAGATERSAQRTSREVNHIERGVFTAEAQGIELHRRSEELLSRYGWIDREQQIVHVPLAVAIQLYLGAPR